jgi:hypothetical protein
LKNKIIATTILTLLILAITSAKTEKAYAWGPCTHIYFTERALKLAGNTTLTNIINRNYEWFMAGMMYPDVTVIYYYTNWKSYRDTHAPDFQHRLWQDALTAYQHYGDERPLAFALGVAVHMLQDGITHNLWIPEKIRGTLVQNNIIHPLSEGLLETRLISEDPLTKEMVYWSFDAGLKQFTDDPYFYDAERHVYLTPVEWCDKVLGRTGSESFYDEAVTFDNILKGEPGKSGFYEKGFVIPQAGGWWSIYRTFSDIIKPFVSTRDADKYINQTIDATVKFFKYGNGDDFETYVPQASDPTGYDALKAADSYVVTWTIAIVIIVIAILVVWHRRKVSKE